MKKSTLFITLFFLHALFNTYAQQSVVVEGIILDKNAEGVVSAVVRVENKQIGAITDFDGRFKLKIDTTQINDPNFNLVISAMGFKKQVVPIDKNQQYTSLKITLNEEILVPIPLPDVRIYRKVEIYKIITLAHLVVFEYPIEHELWYDYKFNGGQ